MADGILAAAPTEAAPATPNPAATEAPKAEAPTGSTTQPQGILAAAEAEPKPTEGAQAKADTPPAPDIEVKLPEGVDADPDLMAALKGVAKESGLKGEQAQKLADAYVAAQQKAQEKLRTEWETRKQDWIATVKKDEELGGSKFNETIKVANRALEKFATPGLRQILEDSGLNNHPEVARLFARIGRTLAEDTIAGQSGNRSEQQSDDSVLRSLYPTMFKE